MNNTSTHFFFKPFDLLSSYYITWLITILFKCIHSTYVRSVYTACACLIPHTVFIFLVCNRIWSYAFHLSPRLPSLADRYHSILPFLGVIKSGGLGRALLLCNFPVVFSTAPFWPSPCGSVVNPFNPPLNIPHRGQTIKTRNTFFN